MIVLDTNVVSELMRPKSDPAVIDWLDRLPTADTFITAVTVAELRLGVARLPRGRRRTELHAKVEDVIDTAFEGCVHLFDLGSTAHFGHVMALRLQRGVPIGLFDAQIAAICLQHGAMLATRNTKDFDGIASVW